MIALYTIFPKSLGSSRSHTSDCTNAHHQIFFQYFSNILLLIQETADIVEKARENMEMKLSLYNPPAPAVTDDLKDKKFFWLTVLSEGGRQGGHVLWRCRCVCGRITQVRATRLINHIVRSCGCPYTRELSKQQNGISL